jgi:hypothetical protein
MSYWKTSSVRHTRSCKGCDVQFTTYADKNARWCSDACKAHDQKTKENKRQAKSYRKVRRMVRLVDRMFTLASPTDRPELARKVLDRADTSWYWHKVATWHSLDHAWMHLAED